jgi:hypothetical protein|tara:strand:- start:313 stop:504 length:192 start_codon:yes stop_codon:yes gene_type:complete
MAVDIIAAQAAQIRVDTSILALRLQVLQEGAAVNLIEEAVEEVQEFDQAGERRSQQRLLDIEV